MLDSLIVIRLIRLIRLINETNTHRYLPLLKMVDIDDGIVIDGERRLDCN